MRQVVVVIDCVIEIDELFPVFSLTDKQAVMLTSCSLYRARTITILSPSIFSMKAYRCISPKSHKVLMQRINNSANMSHTTMGTNLNFRIFFI